MKENAATKRLLCRPMFDKAFVRSVQPCKNPIVMKITTIRFWKLGYTNTVISVVSLLDVHADFMQSASSAWLSFT